MDTQDRIIGLTLSGFQIFDNLTEIPLGRLTLMFGPNSAGKSAVEDALFTLQQIWQRNIDQPSPLINDLIMRNWRRTGTGPSALVKEMHLRATIRQSIEINEPFCITTGRDLRDTTFHALDNQITINEVELRASYNLVSESGDATTIPQPLSFEIFADGLLLTSNTRHCGISVNLGHPALSQLKIYNDFSLLSSRHPEALACNNEMVSLRGDFSSLRVVKPGTIDIDTTIRLKGFFSATERSNPGSINYGSVLDGMEELLVLHNGLANVIVDAISFERILVPASRTVPTNRDLTFLIPLSGNSPSIAELGLVNSGDERYYRLATSFIKSIVAKTSFKDCFDTNAEEHLAPRVNALLLNHLFIERGYRLGFDYRMISAPSQLAPESATEFIDNLKPELSWIILTIYLYDADGRRFSFDEVGSGLGYVLPIICALCQRHPNLVMLQQPELHLHPALQAALGDVLIETLQNGKDVIVETHSEHLILRILKRIRQTNARSHLTTDFLIAADDVSVLYFEPTPQGRTRVRHLRIGDDGEFLDRWPQGFFAERDRELLDE